MYSIIKFIFLLSIGCCFMYSSHAQSLSGHVIDVIEKKGEETREEPLIGANVYWAGTTTGTMTDVEGAFSIDKITETNLLVVSYVGYQNDTLAIGEEGRILIKLTGGSNLEEVKVNAKKESTVLSMVNPIKLETITAEELCKAACCNLSESFETNATVNVSYSDAVSGAKEIKMLGLDGVYTQMMTENIPNLRGISSTYGLTYIPGIWMEAIQVNKGAGSVANGYESITGQINVEHQKPDKAERIYLNLFGSSMGRAEINLNVAHIVNDTWSTGTLFHIARFSNKIDHNKDGFLDRPLNEMLTLHHRWKFDTDKRKGSIGFKILGNNILGGQMGYEPGDQQIAGNPYGIEVRTKRAEVFSKTGFIFGPKRSLGVILSAMHHQTDNFFGAKTYDGQQNSLYANLIYQHYIDEADQHLIKTGASFQFDDYEEYYNGTLYERMEAVPGVFTEYTFNNNNNFVGVLGLRADYHNLYGVQVNPRLHIKYDFTPEMVIRGAAGRGFRVPNMFAENTNIMASARSFEVLEDIQPEVAWNYGINFTHKFKIGLQDAYWSADFYRTDFVNQLIVDPFSTNDKILFYNLDGESYANSTQVEVGMEVIENFDAKLAFKYDDVKATYNNELIQLPLQPIYKSLLNLSYETPNKHWKIDGTTHWTGPQVLMNSEFTINENETLQSDPFFDFHLQLTYVIRNWEFYLGGENLSNYTQKNPIIGAENPFGNTFDATNIYAPIFGRMYYGGLRWRIAQDDPILKKSPKKSKFTQASIKTSSQCGACVPTILGGLEQLDGIQNARLDLDTQVLSLEYNHKQVSIEDIRFAITQVGYDADHLPANPEAYDNLPACCKKGGMD